MKQKIYTSVLATVFLLSPAISFAETATITALNTQVQALLEQIKVLQAQIATRNTAQVQLQTAQSNISQTLKLIRNLREGMTGDDVKSLQAILSADSNIYPEGKVTGYFGRLTAEAVKKFQKKHGIDSIGSVGPKTLVKLNEKSKELGLYEEEDETDTENTTSLIKKSEKKLCAKIPPGHLIAEGWLKKGGNEKPIVPECQKLPQGIASKFTASVIKDTIAPILSDVSATTTGTTVSVSWKTDELATGKVWFGSPSPINTSLNPFSISSFIINHSATFSGLATSTTYYYIVSSADVSGNTATSTQYSATTLAI
ncbi:MAG: peptidoglycan-binding protein [Candidatus Paceibacterota bacterium]|jgi:peptidoglycan hydrolase-like protein with peptidoglycan-binding domain